MTLVHATRPAMDKVPLPSELWHRIFGICCMDGGFTGRSLSLVSKRIHELSKRVKYHSIAIRGAWQAVQFMQLLEARSFEPQPVCHLFITDEYPYDKITRHMDDGTLVPRKLGRLFGGQTSNDGADRLHHKEYLKNSGVKVSKARFLTQSPLARISRQRARAEVEARRQRVIDVGLRRFPLSDERLPWTATADDGEGSGLNHHLIVACAERILEIVSPDLVTFATPLTLTLPHHDPYHTTPALDHRAVKFPRLKELSTPHSVIWLPACPVIERVAVVGDMALHRGMVGISLFSSELFTRTENSLTDLNGFDVETHSLDEEQPQTLVDMEIQSLFRGATHLSFDLPSTNSWPTSLDDWVEHDCVELFRLLGVGESPETRLCQPLRSQIPPSIQHIILRLDTATSQQIPSLDHIVAKLQQLTERDERVRLVTVPTSFVHTEAVWLDAMNGGELGWG